jgi:hypothetical protein
MNLASQCGDFSFFPQNMATFAKNNPLYNLHMIFFATINSPKGNKSIGA